MLPEVVGFTHEPAIGDGASNQEAMVDDTDPPQTGRDGEHEYGVAQGDACTLGWVHPGEHPVSGGFVLLADSVGEWAFEMGKLLGK